jgi:hypothetical protein
VVSAGSWVASDVWCIATLVESKHWTNWSIGACDPR